MSNLKESIAAAIAIVVLPGMAGAQVPAAVSNAPRPVPVKQEPPGPNANGSLNQSVPVSQSSETKVGAEGKVANGAGQVPTSAQPAPAPVPAAASAVPPQPYRVPTEDKPGAPVAYGVRDGVQQEDNASGVGVAHASEANSPAKTHSYRFTATVDVANVLWRSGRGNDLFSEKDPSWRLGIGIGYDLLQLPERLVLALEAGYLGEPVHGDNLNPVAGSLRGSLSASTILLGTSLRWAVTPWMAPYARLGMLASRVSMDIDTESNASGSSEPVSWSHHKWTEGALMGAGVMMTLLPQSRVNVGLLLEGGLWLQRDVAMELTRELPGGAIGTSGARIGTLENTGPYCRLAGVLRF